MQARSIGILKNLRIDAEEDMGMLDRHRRMSEGIWKRDKQELSRAEKGVTRAAYDLRKIRYHIFETLSWQLSAL
jgi:hypothetical protein